MPLWSLPSGKTNGARRRDELFWRFITVGFGIVALYGLGMTAVLLFGDEALGLRMLNIFPGVLGSVLGLGTGYLLGGSNVGGPGTNCECWACVEARRVAADRYRSTQDAS